MPVCARLGEARQRNDLRRGRVISSHPGARPGHPRWAGLGSAWWGTATLGRPRQRRPWPRNASTPEGADVRADSARLTSYSLADVLAFAQDKGRSEKGQARGQEG